MREHRSADRVALALFARRREISISRVRRAYEVLFSGFESYVRSLTDADEPLDVADDAAEVIAHRARRDPTEEPLRRRLRGRRDPLTNKREDIGVLLQDVYASFLSLILAGRTSEMELEGLLEATGVAAAARDHVPGGTALVPELPLDTILELGETMTVDGARRRVEAASASDLHQARDDAITFRTFATEFTRFASRAP